jgi:hypothetical protein
MTIASARTLFAAIVVAMAGCAAEGLPPAPGSGVAGAESGVIADASDDGEIGVSKQALTGWPSRVQHWVPGGDVWLEPASTHLCVLTRVQGKFLSLAEEVRLSIENSNGVATWRLRGKSLQPSVGATAMCFDKSLFLTSGVGSSFDVNALVPGAWYTGGSCSVVSKFGSNPGWQGLNRTSFTMIAGMAGGFFGSGNLVRAAQATSMIVPNNNNMARVQACANPTRDDGFNNVDGWFTSFRTADLTEKLPLFKGPAISNGILSVGNASQIKVFKASGPYGTSTGVNADEAFCGITHIEGKFSGGAEKVELSIGSDGKWFFHAPSQSAGGGVKAEARCYVRDQRIKCSVGQTSNCAKFGCACADGACSGGNCPGGACTAQRTYDCGLFGCGCSTDQCVCP